jgi:hypothetical protein
MSQQLSADLLDIKIRQVFGYPGPAEYAVALQREEVEIATPIDLTYLKAMQQLVDEGMAAPLYQDGVLDESGDVIRASTIADVPTAAEVYEEINGSAPSGQTWDAYEAIISLATVGIPFIAGQNTDPEVVEALQEAFVEVEKSDSWQEQIAKTYSAELALTGPDACRLALEQLTSLPARTVEHLKAQAHKGE